MNKVYKGYELIKEILDGNTKSGTKITVHTPNYDTDYWFWGNWFGEKDGYSKKIDNIELHLCNKNCTFELIEEDTIDIDSIEEYQFPSYVHTTSIEEKLVELINEDRRAIKQLNRELKEVK